MLVHYIFIGSLFLVLQVEIPRAFVCAESKIFDVSEWAICQVSGKLFYR